MPTNITCKIKEIENYQLTQLTLKESLGGTLPTGSLSFLWSDDSQDLSIEHLTMDLIISDDYQLSMVGFIDSSENYRGANQFEITFVPKDFYQTPRINSFTGVQDMINRISPYELLNEFSSDCNLNSVKLFQNNITDYKMLTRYLSGLKAKQSYSFRFDGLYLADLTAKPTETLNISSVMRDLSLTVDRSKFRELSASISTDSKNDVENIHYNNEVSCVTNDLSIAARNKYQNSMLLQSLTSKFSYSFITYMDFRAGDLIKFTGTDYEANNYVVIDNELIMTPGSIINNITFAENDSN